MEGFQPAPCVVRVLLAMEHVQDTTQAWSAPGVTVANRLHVLAL